MHNRKYILAIDLGTSGPKVGLVTTHGEILGHEFETIPLWLLPEGGAEQDPEDWWNAIVTATGRLLTRGLVPVNDIVALSCTTQWSGTVAVDRSGKHLMNAIIWMDSRGAPYIRQITGGLIEINGYALYKLWTWVRLTGGSPGQAGKDPIAHILYIKDQIPDVYQAVYKFLEPKDYLNMRMTGRFAASYDSICLHWLTDNRDLSKVAYDQRLLRMSGIDREKLPDLMRAVDILGPLKPEAARQLGLTENVQVVVGAPDIQSAAVGSGAVRDYQAHLYLGTSSWLCCHVPFMKTDVFHNMASLPSAIPDRYLLTNEQECAGACVDYLKDKILFPKEAMSQDESAENTYQIINQMAVQAPPGSGGLIFTPWLYGERSPVDDHLVRGGFFNQSLETTRYHLVRAVFEGVAYNSRWLLKYVEKFIKRQLGEINVVGGGAQSDLWCQIHADVLNRPIRQVEDPILVNVRGAAFLASISLGDISFDDIPEITPYAEYFQPQPENQETYNELFREFVNLYERNRPIYARLNRIKAY